VETSLHPQWHQLLPCFWLNLLPEGSKGAAVRVSTGVPCRTAELQGHGDVGSKGQEGAVEGEGHRWLGWGAEGGRGSCQSLAVPLNDNVRQVQHGRWSSCSLLLTVACV